MLLTRHSPARTTSQVRSSLHTVQITSHHFTFTKFDYLVHMYGRLSRTHSMWPVLRAAARYGTAPAFREGGGMTLAEYRKTLIGSCPNGWEDMPCSPICPSGTAALQFYPAAIKASGSWPNGTEPSPTGAWNSGGPPPGWIEFEINATAGKLAGVVATVRMEPGGQAVRVCHHHTLLRNTPS